MIHLRPIPPQSRIDRSNQQSILEDLRRSKAQAEMEKMAGNDNGEVKTVWWNRD